MHRTLRPFELFEPENSQDALNLLSEYRDKAKLLAGGIDLVAKMRRWKINPEYLVSIRRIPGLDYIKGNGSDGLAIGALTTLRSVELSSTVKKEWIVLYEAVHQIASVQVKTMGTMVGNLCVATPASDIVPVLFVLGANLKVIGPASKKSIPIENFYTGVGQTILQPDEIVTEIVVPGVHNGTYSAFLKLEKTRADIAKVNVAVAVTVINGTCKEVKIALGAVAPTVIRAKKAEEILMGQKVEQKIIRKAAQIAAGETNPINDLRSTAEYRREMVETLVRRAIEISIMRAKAITGGAK